MKNTPLRKIPTVLLSAVLFALFLMAASSVSANGTTILPTSVSGGVGVVFDIKANDSRVYEVAKGNVATTGGFGAYGGAITSVYLLVEYTVDAGYSGTNAIQVNGIDTSIVPADGESARWVYVDITGGSFGIDTDAEITTMSVTFDNNDGAQGDSVHFNYLNLLVNPTLPITMPPAIGDFVDPETPQGSLPVADSGGTIWELAFSDEFNGTSLDTSKWGIDVSSRSRAARPSQGIDDWWWKSENVTIDGSGFVELHVTKEDSNTMHCGSISSDGLYEPQYGYLEARIKIADTGKSTHTAFWTQAASMIGNPPDDNSAADGAEVDVFESAWTGDYTKAVVHIDGYGAGKNANTKQYSTPGLHSGYHVFGLEWTADSMKIYYDGVLKVTYTGSWVPQVQEWLWLSVGASFGDVGSFVSEAVGPLTSAEVDYVRVWQEFVDTTPPAVSSLSPNDEATSVAVSSNLVLTFDEDIVAGTGLITLKNLTDTSQSTIDITDGSQVSISGTTLTINPSSNLLYNKDYAIQIAATAVEDLEGNAFAGISDDTTWNFATEITDTADPQIASLSPTDDAPGVLVGSDLVITFDEDIVAGTGLITLKNLTDTTEITMAVTDGTRVTISGATMTINPAADLDPGKDYAVQIAATAIDDLAGRSFAGIADDTTWNFTAMTPSASVIYEPFAYPNGTIDGTQGGATGTTGNWTQTGGSELFKVVTPSLSFNGLASTGGAARRTSAPGGSEIAIGMSSAAQTALLADDTSIYFSLLIDTRTFSEGNENLAFAIGTGAFDDNDQDKVLPTITGGEGIGVVFDNGTDTVGGQQIAGFLIDGGAAAESAGVISVGSTTDTYMIVGRIDWAANGSSDTLTLYNIAEPSGEVAPELPGSPFATMTADLDQSLFDTMTIADRQVGTIDEIRFGTTLADVGIAGGAPSNNNVPVFTADPFSAAAATEDLAYSGTISGSATDADVEDTLSYAKVSGPVWLAVASDGTLSGTPVNADVGENAFTVSVTDGKSTPVQATLNITVVNTNDAPAFLEDPINGLDGAVDIAYTGTISGSAADDDADAYLTYAKVSGPSWLSVASDGTLSGTPTNGDLDANAFVVSVTDGVIATPVEATLNITVIAAPNNPPVFTVDPISGSDATEDTAYSGTLDGSATDEDAGDTLTYAKISGPAWLSVNSDGTLSGIPTNSDVGSNAFTVSVTDGIAPAVQATLNITVINTNDAPTFVVDPITGSDATEGEAYSGSIAGSATDVDAGSTLTYAKVSGPAWLSISTAGLLSGTPGNSDVGANSFTVSVTDGIAAPVTATLNIQVEGNIVADYAYAEVLVAGTVSGSITGTFSSDGAYEAITEDEINGKPADRYSYLEHKWEFDVIGGASVSFNVEAHRSANGEGDNFIFAYSTTGVDGAYTDMLTVTKTTDDDTEQSFTLPGGTSGVIHVRVLDTDQSPGNRNFDTLSIDHMYILSQPTAP